MNGLQLRRLNIGIFAGSALAACWFLLILKPFPGAIAGEIREIVASEPELVVIGSSFTGMALVEEDLARYLDTEVAVIGIGRSWGYQIEYVADVMNELLPDAELVVEVSAYERVEDVSWSDDYRYFYYWDCDRLRAAIEDGLPWIYALRIALVRWIPIGRWREYFLPSWRGLMRPLVRQSPEFDRMEYEGGWERGVVVLPPGAWERLTAFSDVLYWPPTGMRLQAEAPVIKFGPDTTPEVFEAAYRFDRRHLNRAGAEVFTRIFAQRLQSVSEEYKLSRVKRN